MLDKIQQAKEKITIIDLWRILNLEGDPKPNKLVSSPWREDKKPSLSIFSDGRAFKDHGEGTGGDAICFLERALGINRKEAVKKFLEIAGMSDGEQETIVKTRRTPESFKQRDRPEFPLLREGTDEEHRSLADLRGVSLLAVKRMVKSGMLFFCNYKNYNCWLITDKTRVNAQVRKLSGELFDKAKAKTLPNSWAKWPIGASQAGSKILLLEGGPDLLAAHDDVVNQEWSPVCMFGGSMEIHPAAMPLFYGKEVCIVPHNDDAGRKTEKMWTSQLQGIASKVWSRKLPWEAKDLNDYVTAELKNSAGGA